MAGLLSNVKRVGVLTNQYIHLKKLVVSVTLMDAASGCLHTSADREL